MNTLKGRITGLTTSNNQTLVDIDVDGSSLLAITIGTPDSLHYLHQSENRRIDVIFNESEVSIGKNIQGKISLSNQLDCKIKEITTGEIFSQIHLSFKGHHITSLITTRSVKRLDLHKGDSVTAFIKTNEVFLKEPEETEDYAD